MRVKGVLILLAAAFLFAAAQGRAEEAGKKVKVVYHFNSADPKLHKAGLINIQNHLDAEEGEVEIIAVAHGDGLTMFQEGKTEPDNFLRIRNLKKQGVKFKICSVTMKRKKIDISELKECSAGDIVKSGVAEIARLEQKGYAYIKP
ncbi:MAG: DsrE family protein [Nitrospirae bacterium]|nr:DsrE family protein [Nitrospirota bacterium]MCL5238414.1 DsrE family protein [Nitrospirota bacterium]